MTQAAETEEVDHMSQELPKQEETSTSPSRPSISTLPGRQREENKTRPLPGAQSQPCPTDKEAKYQEDQGSGKI